jgi:hypothetical protein
MIKTISTDEALLIGGRDESGHSVGPVEILTENSTACRSPLTLPLTRYGHMAALVGGGKLLTCGGLTDEGGSGMITDNCDIFDSTEEGGDM